MTEDTLVADFRRFILSYAEHDPNRAGFEASGQDATDLRVCNCGLIDRMEEPLVEVSRRLG